ncbi:metallophosphoesterase family protein [Kineococcus sp. SYSU DK004]|uniref:metallophosphoesterase family protein n=1 Tax=Kineococcus sp. SYSU DK004 TaxID=3383125 RepID=UPI003D7D59BB
MSARLLHLSDTHLLADAGLHQGAVDTTAALGDVLAGLGGLGALDAVVVSGDVSEDGTPASYAAVRALVEGFARPRGAAVVWAVGNHDARTPFAAGLLDRPDHDPDEPVDAVVDAGGLRLVSLDTSVPGAGYGELRPAQLERLAELLRGGAPRGTVVVHHHPVLPAPTVLHEALRLQRPHELLDVVRGTDVRVLLSGHYHHPYVAALDGVTAVVAPAVANRTDVLVPAGRERAVRGSGACLVDLGDDGQVRVTVLTVPRQRDGEVVVDLDEEAVRSIAAAAGVPAS